MVEARRGMRMYMILRVSSADGGLGDRVKGVRDSYICSALGPMSRADRRFMERLKGTKGLYIG